MATGDAEVNAGSFIFTPATTFTNVFGLKMKPYPFFKDSDEDYYLFRS